MRVEGWGKQKVGGIVRKVTGDVKQNGGIYIHVEISWKICIISNFDPGTAEASSWPKCDTDPQ